MFRGELHICSLDAREAVSVLLSVTGSPPHHVAHEEVAAPQIHSESLLDESISN